MVDQLSITNHDVCSIPPTDTIRIFVGVLIIFYYFSQIQFPSDNYCTYQLKNALYLIRTYCTYNASIVLKLKVIPQNVVTYSEVCRNILCIDSQYLYSDLLVRTYSRTIYKLYKLLCFKLGLKFEIALRTYIKQLASFLFLDGRNHETMAILIAVR